LKLPFLITIGEIMSSKFDYNSRQKSIEYYTNQTKLHGESSLSTMLDVVVREKEIEAIMLFLQKTQLNESCQNILEIGCGNGFLAETITNEFEGRFSISGIDITEDQIKLAKNRKIPCQFSVGDICELPYDNNSFDIVISQRVIINILKEEEQVLAYSELHRVLRDGGQMILIEGYKDGLSNLNRAREEFLLSPILEPAVNNWYTEERWQQFLSLGFREFLNLELEGLSPENFLSSHYFVTRFLHDFLKPEGGKIRNTEFALFFSKAFLPIGDYSPLRVKYLKKL